MCVHIAIAQLTFSDIAAKLPTADITKVQPYTIESVCIPDTILRSLTEMRRERLVNCVKILSVIKEPEKKNRF